MTDDNTIDVEVTHVEEDLGVLRVLLNKVFRRAIQTDARMPEPVDVEASVAELHGPSLDDVLGDLNAARDGETDVDWRLLEWKAALGI